MLLVAKLLFFSFSSYDSCWKTHLFATQCINNYFVRKIFGTISTVPPYHLTRQSRRSGRFELIITWLKVNLKLANLNLLIAAFPRRAVSICLLTLSPSLPTYFPIFPATTRSLLGTLPTYWCWWWCTPAEKVFSVSRERARWMKRNTNYGINEFLMSYDGAFFTVKTSSLPCRPAAASDSRRRRLWWIS